MVLTDALAIESDFPSLLIDRAAIREKRGNRQGAVEDRDHFKALTRIELDDPAKACVSEKLYQHSRDAALALCDKAIESQGEDVELQLRRGYLLYSLARASEAMAAYRTATDLDPSNPRAKYGLGKLIKDAGRSDEGDLLMAEALGADSMAGADFDTDSQQLDVSAMIQR